MNEQTKIALRHIIAWYQVAALDVLCRVYALPYGAGAEATPEMRATRQRSSDIDLAIYWLVTTYAQIAATPDLGGGFLPWLRSGGVNMGKVGQFRNVAWLARVADDVAARLLTPTAVEEMTRRRPLPESLDLPLDAEPVKVAVDVASPGVTDSHTCP